MAEVSHHNRLITTAASITLSVTMAQPVCARSVSLLTLPMVHAPAASIRPHPARVPHIHAGSVPRHRARFDRRHNPDLFPGFFDWGDVLGPPTVVEEAPAESNATPPPPTTPVKPGPSFTTEDTSIGVRIIRGHPGTSG